MGVRKNDKKPTDSNLINSNINMKILTPLLLALFLFSCRSAQDLEKNNMQLQRENDSLSIALEKCQHSPFQAITQSLEDRKQTETPEYSRPELHEKLLPKIKLKSAQRYNNALKIIAATDSFIQYIDRLKEVLISRSGGMNAQTNQPAGIRDRQVAAAYFIGEKQGEKLRSAITDLRNNDLIIVQGNPYFENRIVLLVDDPGPGGSAKSWEEYKFKGMPLAAVFPMLAKYQSDAIASETAVLQYLNE